ncbi:MAG: hypothetical protein IPJ88_02020 [Myxococcales bacterium]|nr:MAG: hypothetical protein IPJ88_02020 [Myxococcales bacterium]
MLFRSLCRTACLVLLGACSSSALKVDVSWFTRKACASTDCPESREISVSSSDGEYSVDCNLSGGDGAQILDFQAYRVENNQIVYGMQLHNALIGSNQFAGGSSCVFEVKEDNYYSGACGINPPSVEQPCQLTDLVLGDGSVSGKILCRNLPLVTYPEQTVSVTSPESSAQPFEFSCTGL